MAEANPDTATMAAAEAADLGSKPPQAEAGAASLAPAGPVKDPVEKAAAKFDKVASEPAVKPVHELAPPAPRAHSSRFALLAASVALAAVFGGFLGSVSASGLAHFWSVPVARPSAAEANALSAIKAQLAELAVLKANLDGATRSAGGQFAKITERLDHVEHAQVEPATKIAHIAETIDRLEKKSAAAAAAAAARETTGTIAASQPSPASAAKASDKVSSDKVLSEKVLEDWVVRRARGGYALVENRYGRVFDVSAGTLLPGLGRVEAVKRQDGEWIVVTEHGLITPAQ